MPTLRNQLRRARNWVSGRLLLIRNRPGQEQAAEQTTEDEQDIVITLDVHIIGLSAEEAVLALRQVVRVLDEEETEEETEEAL